MAEHVTFFKMKAQPGKLNELKAMMSGEESQRIAARGWTQPPAGGLRRLSGAPKIIRMMSGWL